MMGDAGKSPEDVQSELEKLRKENAEFRKLLGLDRIEHGVSIEEIHEQSSLFSEPVPLPTVTNKSAPDEKIELFRTLFKGRENVYARFWRDERTGKRGYSPACEGPAGARRGKARKFLPLTTDVIRGHLEGRETIGIYPLLEDHTCWFLACDFDKQGWILDAAAFLQVCRRYGIPAYLERSRSGNGGHVWIFFSEPVQAASARQLGIRLLRETMVLRWEMDLASYDRFFPSQDFSPRGGFGNLIALPFQKQCRILGNTEFLNPVDTFQPGPDQWVFLSPGFRD